MTVAQKLGGLVLFAVLALIGSRLTWADSDKPGKPVTYQDVLKLLELGIDEQEIIKRLEKSPTLFTLDTNQEQELKKAGATDKLLAAMKGKRRPAGNTSDVTDFALILDCSGSMIDKTREGPTKMEVAKKVVSDLIEKIPNGRRVTFLVYGHDAKLECKAIKVVRPLSEIDDAAKAEIKQFIRGLKPVGHTPIARALEIAGQELAKNNANCGLILITDGMETCHGDPNAVAARLASELKLTFGLHVIGFDVDPKELEAVKEIAKAGKGTYHDARSATELTKILKGLEEKLTEKPVAAADRPDRKVNFAGQDAKPGAFFNDAPLVAGGEFKGALPFMGCHYYQIAVRKGQELRAIGKVQKAPYQVENPQNGNDIQTFSITIYDQTLALVAREKIDIRGNPSDLATLKAVWQAPADSVAYVAIAASDTHDPRGKHGFLFKSPNVKSSNYTLTLKLNGEVAPNSAGPAALERLKTAAGNGFGEAGELPMSGLAVTDIKLQEVAFFKTKVNKGDSLTVSLAAQKPLTCVENDFRDSDNRTTYTLTVYDDDQVEIGKKQLHMVGNPPDPGAVTATWTAALSGTAYISVGATNTGNKIMQGGRYPKPGPGRVAVQLIKAPSVEAR
jgi:Mg-chelatase subunit ChlD